MKILAVCGSGLGTSFMVEMNIKQVLEELGVTGVEVSHSDLSSATPEDADVYFLAKDIAESGKHLGEIIVLENIIDMDELREKVKKLGEDKNLI
ncbi:PTS sugar transporter subunit IIB [Salipaludibacillus agaradhaerens]|jgi:PTS system ascorbate-specific IIB component|uniref:PTS sugar transporter subunit IIB n=1 Tax=Salipaludibacillus agaradhaerens TaxID=76935 RepID=A0A9Q4B4A6_SALAG|nr:PTS sugar transporter subunit IIB [Salipaludibacillus agaradhaerens]MCR6109512.1 PTS sugar transporter subunit IIB [Bacillus sp. A301a_S52]UJW56654.1 PTS sugar transporter subunit IIB [Bacillus sp. A116_S68]MCR6097720.1 PTS sugar transporter subunit IIB [Salipaludibacillus agaradhaerens]MCR6105426.1 PTS sugar transporter subunit IIB [Salipaludibacillus agaradhaerens]MCR6112796.1 PTS sugar transporter subunit IIB [Salipaludibacillus agaradhaerens]